MKKLFSLLLTFTMVLSFCSCSNNRVDLVKNTPLLNLEELWITADNNEAKAMSQYNKKQYKLTLPVLNIDTTSFTYSEEFHGVTRDVCVNLPTEELAKLTSGEAIMVLGTVKFHSRFTIVIEDAFVTLPYEETKEFSREETEKAIADFGGDDGDGVVNWTEGSYPFFMDNRLNFEEIPWENLYATLAGKWKAKHYSPSEFEIEFTSEISATILEGGKTKVWEYEISNDLILLPKHRNGVPYHEVRKVSDNLIVFYDNPMKYTPKLILYK